MKQHLFLRICDKIDKYEKKWVSGEYVIPYHFENTVGLDLYDKDGFIIDGQFVSSVRDVCVMCKWWTKYLIDEVEK